MKETVLATWSSEVYGYAMFGTFTDNHGQNAVYIPDPEKVHQKG